MHEMKLNSYFVLCQVIGVLDQLGIVQGEFGFITADGVYHVTVYATDENGNFKILSMRNIRISAPLDGSPATGPISPEAEKYIGKHKPLEPPKVALVAQAPQERVQPTPQSTHTIQTVTPRSGSYVFTTQSTIKPACGGCGYITTQKPLSEQSFQFQNPNFREPGPSVTTGGGIAINQGNNQGISTLTSSTVRPVVQTGGYDLSSTNIGIGINPERNQQIFKLTNSRVTTESQTGGIQNQHATNISPLGPQQYESERNLPSSTQHFPNIPDNSQGSISPPSINLHPPGTSNQDQSGFSGPSQFNSNNEEYQNYPQNTPTAIGPSGGNIAPYGSSGVEFNPVLQPLEGTSKLPPISVSGNSIHVGGNKPVDIPIKDKYPSMADGLPNGIEEKDIKDILYKFHYTVGFHGHYEKGLKNGAKIGGYFVNGRDGISRVVTYIADENGYRPKFKFINLGLDSADTPKEESEKQFGLKSFEFVWYPIE